MFHDPGYNHYARACIDEVPGDNGRRTAIGAIGR